MQVRPVNLPVKSTSVVSSEGYWDSTVARWQQAKRHAQGVAEASYACFATWELLRHFPVRKMNTTIAFYLWRTVLRVVCVHTLPIFQVVPIGLLSLYWFANGYDVPMCPDRFVGRFWEQRWASLVRFSRGMGPFLASDSSNGACYFLEFSVHQKLFRGSSWHINLAQFRRRYQNVALWVGKIGPICSCGFRLLLVHGSSHVHIRFLFWDSCLCVFGRLW